MARSNDGLETPQYLLDWQVCAGVCVEAGLEGGGIQSLRLEISYGAYWARLAKVAYCRGVTRCGSILGTPMPRLRDVFLLLCRQIGVNIALVGSRTGPYRSLPQAGIGSVVRIMSCIFSRKISLLDQPTGGLLCGTVRSFPHEFLVCDAGR